MPRSGTIRRIKKEGPRQVVVLRYMEGFSQAETAEVLGWSQAKVRVTASRAMARVRELTEVDERAMEQAQDGEAMRVSLEGERPTRHEGDGKNDI